MGILCSCSWLNDILSQENLDRDNPKQTSSVGIADGDNSTFKCSWILFGDWTYCHGHLRVKKITLVYKSKFFDP